MTCEDFLMQYRNAMERITEVSDEIAALEAAEGRMVAAYEVERVKSRSSDNGPIGAQEMDELDELRRQKQQMLLEAEAKRLEIQAFIATVGDAGGPDDVLIRQYRRMLTMYYCNMQSWQDVGRLSRSVVMRRGRTVINTKRKPGISDTALWRRRREALAKAELAWVRWRRR